MLLLSFRNDLKCCEVLMVGFCDDLKFVDVLKCSGVFLKCFEMLLAVSCHRFPLDSVLFEVLH